MNYKIILIINHIEIISKKKRMNNLMGNDSKILNKRFKYGVILLQKIVVSPFNK